MNLPCSLFPACPYSGQHVEKARRLIHPTTSEATPHIPLNHATPQHVLIAPTRALELEHNRYFVALLAGEETLYTAKEEFVSCSRTDRARGRSPISVLSDDMVDIFDDSGAPRGILALKPGLHQHRCNDCTPVETMHAIVSFCFRCEYEYVSSIRFLRSGTPVQFTQTLDLLAGIVKVVNAL